MHIEEIRKEYTETEPAKEEIVEKLEKLETENVNEDIKVIFDFRFLQEIQKYKEKMFSHDNIYFTKNDFESIDLDSYYVYNYIISLITNS